MASAEFELFIILIRLKSYLISMIDDPRSCENNFYYSEEYLDRRFPEQKEEVLELLESYGITNDCDIAFNEQIHLRFREMVKGKEHAKNLQSILSDFEIEAKELLTKEKKLDEFRLERENKIKEIINVLLQIARMWSTRSLIENEIDDFSVLDEEEVIRPEEILALNVLDKDVTASFRNISQFTNFYLSNLVDYYFLYGGDIALAEFVKGLEEFKTLVSGKYSELFKKHGLDHGDR